MNTVALFKKEGGPIKNGEEIFELFLEKILGFVDESKVFFVFENSSVVENHKEIDFKTFKQNKLTGTDSFKGGFDICSYLSPNLSMENYSIYFVLDNSGYLSFSVDSKQLDRNQFNLQAIVNSAYPVYDFDYGFEYLRKTKWVPPLFANGAIYETAFIDWIKPLKWLENLKLNRWGIFLNMRREKLPFILRDIYPVNYLKESHLSLVLEGRTLKEYILENRLGSLEPLNSVIFVWRLDMKQIKRAKRMLRKYGMLVANKSLNYLYGSR